MSNTINVILLIWIFTASYDCYGIEIKDKAKLKMQAENTLRFDLDFELTEAASIEIKCYKEKGKESYQSYFSKQKKLHHIVLYDFEPKTCYYFYIYSNGKKISEEKFWVDTGELPELIPDVQLISKTNFKFEGRVVGLFSLDLNQNRNIPNINNPSGSAQNPESYDSQTPHKGNYLVLINEKGIITWYQKIEFEVRPFRLTERKTILVMSETESKLREIDLMGNIVLDLEKEDFNGLGLLRDLKEDENGNLVVLGKLDTVIDFRGIIENARKPKRNLMDAVYTFNRKGKLLKRWCLVDAYSMDEIGKLKIPTVTFYSFMCNSLDVSKNAYLISMRDINQIWKIDKKTGKLIWQLGEDGTVTMTDNSSFYGQHSAFFENGNENQILLYNNNLNYKLGVAKSPENSEIISFNINEKKLAASTSYLVNIQKDYASKMQGGAIKVDKNTFLTNTTFHQKIFFINKKGEILWDLALNNSTFRAEYFADTTIHQ